jgi:translocator protein
MTLNAAWSPVFFGLHQTKAALAIVVLMAMVIFAAILVAWRPNRTAAMLLAPYLGWVLFAAYLNSGIVVLNP